MHRSAPAPWLTTSATACAAVPAADRLPARIGLTIGEILERGRRAARLRRRAVGPARSPPTSARRRRPRAGGPLGGGGDPADARLRMRRRVADDARRRREPWLASSWSPSRRRGRPPCSRPRRRTPVAATRPSRAAPDRRRAPRPASSAAAPAAGPSRRSPWARPPPRRAPRRRRPQRHRRTSSGLPPIKHVWEIVLSEPGLRAGVCSERRAPVSVDTGCDARVSCSPTTTGWRNRLWPTRSRSSAARARRRRRSPAARPTPTSLPPRSGSLGQIRGDGCLYPQSAQTLPDQLAAAGLSWRAYVEGIGEEAPVHDHDAGDDPSAGDDHHAGDDPSAVTTTTPATTPAPVTTTTPATTSATSRRPAPKRPRRAQAPPVRPRCRRARPCPHPALGGADPYQSAICRPLPTPPGAIPSCTSAPC